jgi:hypothetical protein
MLNTQELKASVAKLSAGDLSEFTEWFEEFIAQQWDNEMADSSSKCNLFLMILGWGNC